MDYAIRWHENDSDVRFGGTKDKWHGRFPIADLPKWLNFYRQQMERYPTHAANYAPDVEALEVLARQIGAKLR